jgi:DNA-binding NarL/FixJ family response regulator
MTIRVCLVDDQTLIRDGIRNLLNLSDNIEVVAEASDGRECLERLSETAVDVILLDLSMPVMNGIETLKAMQQQGLDIPVLVLTTFDDHQFILDALQSGASGYLLKDVSLDTLINGIQTVFKGERLVQPALTERLLAGLKGFESGINVPDPVEQLTKREVEVLGLMATGCSNKEMSEIMHKSEGTIKNHVSSILAKLGVRDRTRAVLVAIEKGLLDS